MEEQFQTLAAPGRWLRTRTWELQVAYPEGDHLRSQRKKGEEEGEGILSQGLPSFVNSPSNNHSDTNNQPETEIQLDDEILLKGRHSTFVHSDSAQRLHPSPSEESLHPYTPINYQ